MQSLRYAKIAKAYAEAVVAGDILACRWVRMDDASQCILVIIGATVDGRKERVCPT